MGMYDTCEPARSILCPIDGIEFEDWQTKDLTNTLTYWAEGDRRLLYDEGGRPFRRSFFGLHSLHETAGGNDHWAEAWGVITNGWWTATILVSVTLTSQGRDEPLWNIGDPIGLTFGRGGAIIVNPPPK